jgi:hypothetical protein
MQGFSLGVWSGHLSYRMGCEIPGSFIGIGIFGSFFLQ